MDVLVTGTAVGCCAARGRAKTKRTLAEVRFTEGSVEVSIFGAAIDDCPLDSHIGRTVWKWAGFTLAGYRAERVEFIIHDGGAAMRMTGLKAMVVLTLMAAPRMALAQAAPAAAPVPGAAGPAVGSVAPDFTLPGATRYGLLRTPVRLSDYRGQTVVLAFFYQARTKG